MRNLKTWNHNILRYSLRTYAGVYMGVCTRIHTHIPAYTHIHRDIINIINPLKPFLSKI